MTRVTADAIEAMQAYLKGDADGYSRMVDRLDPAAKKAHGQLIGASFYIAANRRFAANRSNAEVIEFVGNLRARSDRLAEDIDPRQAERLVRASTFTDENVDDIDNGLYSLLLAGLIADEQLTDSDLDAFLEEARKLADDWLA
ncbi:hypothetical protein [Actinoallomurus acaciae]|uniref:Uncharacterized protein n=1 Tax=Actinoallomurus acaciae TaxID=502577 RepID=A0ABV5YLN0_9ACTN